MDVTLPNGTVIKGVPEGTSKEDIKLKAISSGLALETDFPQEVIEQSAIESDTHLGRYQAKLQEILDSGVGIAEATLHHATAVPASVAAGITGIGQTLNPFAETGAGARAVHQVEDALTYAPRSDKGRQIIQSELANDPYLGKGVQMIQGAVDATRMGDETLEAGGGPLLATVNEMGPEIVGSALGLRGMKPSAPPQVKFDKTGTPISQMSDKAEIASELRNNPANPKTAKFDLKDGAAVTSPAGKAALGQGWTESAVAGVKSANESTKAQVRKMVDIARKRLTGGTEVEMKLRPSDVAGDSLHKRYRFIDQANKASGKLLGKIAKDMGDTPVDTTSAAQWFNGKLQELGIEITENGKVDFSQSKLPKSDRAMITENIEQIRRLRGGQSFQSAHELKQIIRRTGLSYKETIAKKGASPEAQKLFKGYSAKIDEVLDSTSPAYDKANIKFGETADVLDGIKGLVKNRLYLDTVDKAMGTKLRRLTGNPETRPDLMAMLEDIDSVSKKYGGQFDDNLYLQQYIANEMDDVLGAVAGTSIKGELGAQAMEQASNRSLMSIGAQTVDAISKKVGGRTEVKALNTLDALTRN